MTLIDRLGIDLPILQAPMAGVQGSALAAAVSATGALGALPCAMLAPDVMADELALLRQRTARPFNVNFFCHAPPEPDGDRQARWHAALARTTPNSAWILTAWPRDPAAGPSATRPAMRSRRFVPTS